jgi:HPt (histidine-containing phosphotransfer) domain-containing protein
MTAENTIPLYSSILGKEPELLNLIKRYINKYPEMISELKKSFEENDWESFDQKLHDIKSTGGNFGYMNITELAIKIKSYLNDSDYKAIQPLLNELENLHKRMQLAIDCL